MDGSNIIGAYVPLDDDDLYWTPAELAERWKCTEGHLANQRVAGDGPPYMKPGKGRVLYQRGMVRRYEHARTFISTSQEDAAS